MKWASFSILLLFSFQIADIPLMPANAAKTCCGRAICTCEHPKNAACPLKKAAAKKETRPHCHFSKTEKPAPEKKIVKTQPGQPVYQAAPCARHTPKTAAASGHLPDFCLEETPGRPRPENPLSFLRDSFSPDCPLFVFSLDRPPRF